MPALAAVLREVEAVKIDLLVNAGDLTEGPLVAEALAVIHGYDGMTTFVRGNAERAILELTDSTRPAENEPTDRETWMLAHHDSEAVAFVRSFSENSWSTSRVWAPCTCVMARRAATPSA